MEVLASWSGRFTPGERATGALCVESFVSSTLTLGKVIKRQNCSLAGTESWKAEVKSPNLTEIFLLPTVTIIMPYKLSHSVDVVELVILRGGRS